MSPVPSPIRVQLQRVKGWRIPPNTVKVDRTTKWGNPFPLNKPVPQELIEWLRLPGETDKFAGMKSVRILDPERCIATYTFWLMSQPELMLSLPELRGKNLACWCRLPETGKPDLCHAAVLLELANDDKR